MKINHNNYLKLAFNLAQKNLGKTSSNPSVGCVVVKNDSVIASGCTSLKGRPHAEYNALKQKINFKNASFYVTMEPCTHYGLTPPCTNLIIKKKIKKLFFSYNDIDFRTAKKAKKKLKENKIKVKQIKINDFKDFYQSYFFNKKENTPLLDAKLAVSKDYFTINNNSKWITTLSSRKRAHLIRSEYDAIISTSKSINFDNSLLNCRINGFNNNKPDLIIVDRKFKIKKNLKLFKFTKKRKIFIITSIFDKDKYYYFKKKGIKIIQKKLIDKTDFLELFKILKRYNYNRILVESGLIFLNELLKNRLISNIFMFQTSFNLKKSGKNNASNKIIKKIQLKNKINVNLNGDSLYKIKF